MITWPSKDPDELLDYGLDWTSQLDGATIMLSEWDIIEGAGIALSGASITGGVTGIRVGGGTLGEAARIENTVTLSSGEVLQETAYLPIKAN